MRLLVFGRSAARIAFVCFGAACGSTPAPLEPPASSREPGHHAPAVPLSTEEDPSGGRAELPARTDQIHAESGPLAPVPAEPGFADLDPDNDYVVAPPEPVPDCEARLKAAGVEFRKTELPVKTSERGAITCGAEQVVEYRGSPSRIRYNAAPVLTCTMALALVRFERALQEEAETHFRSRVKRLTHAGTYSCRRMARYSSMVSEHSYANAIDLRAVTLENGRSIDVLHGFGAPGADPATPEARFLRRAANRAYDEKIFSVVLTPSFDALHRDHFHLDMARYRVDGTR
jgi:hypothetical protein